MYAGILPHRHLLSGLYHLKPSGCWTARPEPIEPALRIMVCVPRTRLAGASNPNNLARRFIILNIRSTANVSPPFAFSQRASRVLWGLLLDFGVQSVGNAVGRKSDGGIVLSNNRCQVAFLIARATAFFLLMPRMKARPRRQPRRRVQTTR